MQTKTTPAKQNNATGTHLRLAKNKTTGLYFDGTGFNAATIMQAREIGDSITEKDFKLMWSGEVEVNNIELEPEPFPGDAYAAARSFVILRMRKQHHDSFAVVHGEKEYSRRVHLPARVHDPAWVHLKGAQMALVLKFGVLSTDM